MTTTTEEKLDINDLHVSNKEKYLTIGHNKTVVTKGGTPLECPNSIYPGTQPVHNDLLNVLQLMVPHMLLIIEVPGFKLPKPHYLTEKTALTDEKLNGYFVNGFSISDKGMLTVKGGIKTKSGKVQPLNATVGADIQTSQYPNLENLLALVEEVKEEAMNYFIDGKFGTGAQGEIDLKPKELVPGDSKF